MFKDRIIVLLLSFCAFLLTSALVLILQMYFTRKRRKILSRLHVVKINRSLGDEEDILSRPFIERTVGFLSRRLVEAVGQITPVKLQEKISVQLEKAGNPGGVKAGDLLAFQGIIGLTVFLVGCFLFPAWGSSTLRGFFLALVLTALAVYLPWFVLSVMATRRQQEIRRSLPDMMDLLVVSVEAGLAFDMALSRVADRFRGTVAQEFQQALREMQVGKPRKEALNDVAERVNLMELSSLVNAVIQSDQLGVGIAGVLRIQADLIREKRQQWIEEQAMKAPIKMIFPMVFLIFPCIFIVILGPSLISIFKVLGGM